MDPMAVPEILSDMSDAEQMLIARLAPTVHEHLLKHGGIASKGHCIRNLGTWFDSKMSMLSHINKTCSSAFYYLYNMRRIRKYLSRSVTESLVHAFITSRIDYCNSLLYGLPNSHIMKLQRIQNAAARLVTGTPRFCHVTPLLFHLHWLPISYRIKFKIPTFNI